VTVLRRALLIENDVQERDVTGIVYGALFRAAKVGPLKAGPLLGEISRGVQGFLEKPEDEFILATSLSGFSMWRSPPGMDGETEVSGGCRIYLARELPVHLREGHAIAKERMRDFVFGEYPDPTSSINRYTAAGVSTRGRSVHELCPRGRCESARRSRFAACDLELLP
jgi:hypothetical protein